MYDSAGDIYGHRKFESLFTIFFVYTYETESNQAQIVTFNNRTALQQFMASKLNLSSVLRIVGGDNIDNDSDWEMSEDELIEEGMDGGIDTVSVLNPLDKVQDVTEDDTAPSQDVPTQSTVFALVPDTPTGSAPTFSTSTPIPSPSTPEPVDTASVEVHQHQEIADHPPFIEKTGSLLTLDGTNHPWEFFEEVFGTATLDMIAHQTNLYAAQCNS